MDLKRWKELVELIGLASIVGSLIFVGLQLQQSQEIALASQYQARAEATQALFLAHLEADYVPPIPSLRAGLSEDISAADINTYEWLWIQMDNHAFQHESGFLAEDSWQAQLRTIRYLYSQCRFRFVWDWRKSALRSEFVSLVESVDDPCVSTGG